jgi:hypothetical protein
VTGFRSGEARNLRWSELDLERSIVTLEDTKSGVSVRPLSNIAIDIIKRQLSHDQSLQVLAQWTKIPVPQLPPEGREIVRECGRLPLALAMVGGLIHRGMLNGRADAWTGALRRLTTAQLDAIRFPLEHYPYPELIRAIQISVDALESSFRERYLMMSVFPDDEPVPESTLRTFWGVDEYEEQSTVDSWLAGSLATRNDQGKIALHDLQLDYVRTIVTQAGLLELNHRLLRQYSSSCDGNSSKSSNDGYLFKRIAWHIARAENWRELTEMLLDGAYIRAKLDVSSYLELAQDFNWSEECRATLANDNERLLFVNLEGMVRQLSGFVNRKEETAIIEGWLEASRGPFILITGMLGSGKSSLIRHLLVRHCANAILISPGRNRSTNEFLSTINDEICSNVGYTGIDTPDIVQQAFSNDHVVSYLCSRLHQTGRHYILLIDGLDEIPLSKADSRIIEDIIEHFWNNGIISIVSSRYSHGLFSQSPTVELGLLLRSDVITRIKGDALEMEDTVLEKIADFAEGHPLAASLLAKMLRHGQRDGYSIVKF